MSLIINNINFKDYEYCKNNKSHINNNLIQLKNKLNHNNWKKVLKFLTHKNKKLFYNKDACIINLLDEQHVIILNLMLALDEKIILNDDDMNIMVEIIKKYAETKQCIELLSQKCQYIKNTYLMYLVIKYDINNSYKYFIDFINNNNIKNICKDSNNIHEICLIDLLVNDNICNNFLFTENNINNNNIDLIIDKLKICENYNELIFSNVFIVIDEYMQSLRDTKYNKIHEKNLINKFLQLQEYINTKYLNSNDFIEEKFMEYISSVLFNTYKYIYEKNNICPYVEKINDIRIKLEKYVEEKINLNGGFKIAYYKNLLYYTFNSNDNDDINLFEYFISFYKNYIKLSTSNIKQICELSDISILMKFIDYLIPNDINKNDLKFIIDILLCYSDENDFMKYCDKYLNKIDCDKTTMKYAIYSNNKKVIKSMMDKKYDFTDDCFIFINNLSTANFEIYGLLDIFIEYNHYMTEKLFIDFYLNNFDGAYCIDGFQKYTIYKDDNDKFQQIKDKIIKIIDFTHNIFDIDDFINNNNITLDVIYQYSSPLTKLLLDKYFTTHTQNIHKTKIIRKVTKKIE